MNKLLVALTVAAISTPVMAQTTLPSVGFDTSVLAKTDFATIDTDTSGGISFDELSMIVPDLSQDDFKALDTDANGELSAEEYVAVQPMDATGSSSN